MRAITVSVFRQDKNMMKASTIYRPIVTATILCLFATNNDVRADDWGQWMGPKRDGVYRETGVIDSIPESGLKAVSYTHLTLPTKA